MDNHNKFLLLTNLAIQMGVIITVGVFLGDYLDSKAINQTRWWTLLLSILSIFCCFLPCFKNAKKKMNKKNIFQLFFHFSITIIL